MEAKCSEIQQYAIYTGPAILINQELINQVQRKLTIRKIVELFVSI